MKVFGLPVIAALAASLLLAGCAGMPEAAPTASMTPTGSAIASSDEDCVICDPDGEVPSEGSDVSAADEAVNCSSLIGAPSSEVLADDHKPTCAVVPGSDGILYGTTTCVGASTEPVYFWTATDEDDPDHSNYQVFAIRDGGTLGTVDDAATLYAALDGIPGISYMQAAGCPGMEKS